MNRSQVFAYLRLLHRVLDRAITSAFGNNFRQKYIRLSYLIKAYAFPEYGALIPTQTDVSLIPVPSTWSQPSIPSWVIEEMKDLSRDIDPTLYPSDRYLSECRYYSFPVLPEPGMIYRKFINQCSSKDYSHCYVIPWLKRGGADYVTLRYIQLVASMPKNRILVIMTEPGDSPWLSRIPAGVDIINASVYVNQITMHEFCTVLTRLLVQLNIGTLHIINSRHAWQILCNNGLAITQRTRIFASIYCDDFDRNGQPVGFAREYLPHCYQFLSKVFSCNNALPNLLQKTYGYKADLFCVHGGPVDFSKDLANRSRSRNSADKSVLWASRIDYQKRPDILMSIARVLKDVKFHVYGDIADRYDLEIVKKLKALDNVRLYGKFDEPKNLPFDEHSLFLYTSQWDGLPRIILDSALAGIPIVASNVGGVGEVINESNGYPVSSINNVDSYIARINEVFDDPQTAYNKAMLCREFVLSNHSDKVFSETILSTKGYTASVCTKSN